MKNWEEQLAKFDAIVDLIPEFERKGKSMPYTSAFGHMFSLLNKDGELGIRLSKEDGEKFMEKYETTRFKSHGSFMRGYVLVPPKVFENAKLTAKYLKKGYEYVCSLEPK